jgi:dGTPase
MIITREILETQEDEMLSPYGIRSQDSKGRFFPEDEREYRTAFQRDRDRILHTTAFRRLKHKTQVFIVTEGDYYRTRLTHTLEVAQIGRTIARALGVNEDLVESICLAHDLGHPPFGHAGEGALAELMRDFGGFDHNKQSFRIITDLAHRYPDFHGLNLTWEVLEGVVKHETEYDIADAKDFHPEKRGHLEAQIANIADELAYSAHDLDDGLRSGMLVPEQINGLELWEMLKKSIQWSGTDMTELVRHRIIRRLIGLEVSDVIQSTNARIEKNEISSVEDVQTSDINLVDFSDKLEQANQQVKAFLYQNLYRHPRVFRMQMKAEQVLGKLFHAYTQQPDILPIEVHRQARVGDFHRVICDYLAGMTDRFAIQEHEKLFNPDIGP